MAFTPQPTRAQGAALSFVAGFVDVVGFVALAGLFTAHVTGNLIMIGVESIGRSDNLYLKILALPVFVAVVAGARLAEKRLDARQRDAVTRLLTIEGILLLCFAAAGIESTITGSSFASTLAGVTAIAAMAIQNALSRTALAELGPTTIMTGNSTQVIVDLVDLRSATASERPAIVGRLRKMIPSILAFGIGAVLGAVLYVRTGYAAPIVPALVLLAICAHRAWIAHKTAATRPA